MPSSAPMRNCFTKTKNGSCGKRRTTEDRGKKKEARSKEVTCNERQVLSPFLFGKIEVVFLPNLEHSHIDGQIQKIVVRVIEQHFDTLF